MMETFPTITGDQIVALLASLGACFSALATFLTVRQIAKQREASYRPELVLSRVYVDCSKNPLAGSAIPTFWAPMIEGKVVASPAQKFSIPLRNIGLGSAKRVVVSWSFPFETLVQEVNELAQRTLSAAYFSFEKGVLSIKSEGLGNMSSMWLNQRTETLDFVLPAAVQSEGVMLELPHAYIQIVSAIFHFAAKDEDKQKFPEIPALRADFEFFDISEKKHSACFDIFFHMAMIGGRGEIIHGSLETKKKPN
jgi:hypothetical protein